MSTSPERSLLLPGSEKGLATNPGSHKSQRLSRLRGPLRNTRAGLLLPVGRIHKSLKKGNYAPKIGIGASVYLTAVLEYLTAELLDLAAITAKKNKKKRVSHRHVLLAVSHDAELNEMMKDTTIPQAGRIKRKHPQLLTRNKASSRGQHLRIMSPRPL